MIFVFKFDFPKFQPKILRYICTALEDLAPTPSHTHTPLNVVATIGFVVRSRRNIFPTYHRYNIAVNLFVCVKNSNASDDPPKNNIDFHRRIPRVRRPVFAAERLGATSDRVVTRTCSYRFARPPIRLYRPVISSG